MARPGRPKSSVRPAKSLAKVSIPNSQRYLELIDGTLKLEDLDDEELFRGQLRADDGTFRGRPLDFIPRDLYVALSKELRTRIRRRFESATEEAVDTILDVMRTGEGEQFSQFERAGTKRLEAAKYVIDRVLGPIGKEIDPGTTNEELTPWERHKQPSGGLIIDIEPEEDDAHLITEVQERRKPIRRRIVTGEVVD